MREYAAQIMANIPGASASTGGDPWNPTVTVRYPDGTTSVISYSSLSKGAANPLHPVIMPPRRTGNIIFSGEAQSASTPFVHDPAPLNYRSMPLLFGLGADLAPFVQGLFGPNVPLALQAQAGAVPPMSPNKDDPTFGIGPPARGDVSVPRPDLPPVETIRAQAKAAFDQTIARAQVPQGLYMTPGDMLFGGKGRIGGGHTFLTTKVGEAQSQELITAATMDYKGLFYDYYRPRIEFDDKRASPAASNQGQRYAGSGEWLMSAKIIAVDTGDDELNAAVDIWANQQQKTEFKAATSSLPDFLSIAKVALFGGAIFLGLFALNTILPRD